MKKLSLLLFLLPAVMLANFYPGTITFNDGSSKTGFIELPGDPTAGKIRFRTDQKGANEKFEKDNVKGFTMTADKVTYEFEVVTLASGSAFKPRDIKPDKFKSWAHKVKEGGITLYATYESSSPGAGPHPGATSSIANTKYYILKKGQENPAFYFMVLQGSGTTFAVNNYKALPKYTKYLFENDCPKLESLINIDDFKKNGIERIVDLYDENCK